MRAANMYFCGQSGASEVWLADGYLGSVDLRFGRSLYWPVTVVVACSMLAVGLSWWLSATAGSMAGAGSLRCLKAGLTVFCGIGAAGVIWLGWYWFSLAKGITSVTDRLTKGQQSVRSWSKAGCRCANAVVSALNDAVAGLAERSSSTVVSVEEQLKDLRLQLRLAQKREKNTEAIIQSIRDAVIVVDEFDKVVMANEAAGRLFNFDFRASQCKPMKELIDAVHGEFATFLGDSKRHMGHASRREMVFGDAGQNRTFDCVVSCVRDQQDQVCGAVAVLHDVTREKEIQQMKNDFVSYVSHELKTPLASIAAYSEMLVDGEASDEQTRKEFYGVIQSQAARLNRLIEDILNVSRIESGLMKVNKQAASMTMLIEEQMQMISSYAEEKNIRIIRQKPIVFDQVYVDKDMMSQVIVNLLSNAIKYTPSGGTVKIETEVDEAASMLRVSVCDTGVGIPEDEIEHVFDKFYRVKAHEKHAKGSGLGLTLVKEIVEKVHQGRVFVTSKVGLGTTFGFELPLARKELVEVA